MNDNKLEVNWINLKKKLKTQRQRKSPNWVNQNRLASAFLLLYMTSSRLLRKDSASNKPQIKAPIFRSFLFSFKKIRFNFVFFHHFLDGFLVNNHSLLAFVGEQLFNSLACHFLGFTFIFFCEIRIKIKEKFV